MSRTLKEWSLYNNSVASFITRDNYVDACVRFRIIPWGVKGIPIDDWAWNAFCTGGM